MILKVYQVRLLLSILKVHELIVTFHEETKHNALEVIFELRPPLPNTVDSPLTDTPNSGYLPYNGHCHMYQLKSPYM